MTAVPQAGARSLTAKRRGLIGPHAARYMFILPALLLTAGTLAYPFFYNLGLSFFSTDPTTSAHTYIGIQNYVDALTEPRFLAAIWRTLVYSFVSSFFAIVLGLGVALVVHHIDLPFKSLILGLLFIPWIMSPVEVALIGKWLVHPIFGPLNAALTAMGLLRKGTSLLGHPSTALWTIIAVYTWKHIPFVMVTAYAALQTLPKPVYEAARLDGARAFDLFWHLTLPLMRPVLVTSAVLIVIWQFGSYAVFAIMTGGGPRGSTEVMSIYIIDLFDRRHFGESAMVAIVLCVIALVLTFIYLLSEFRKVREV